MRITRFRVLGRMHLAEVEVESYPSDPGPGNGDNVLVEQESGENAGSPDNHENGPLPAPTSGREHRAEELATRSGGLEECGVGVQPGGEVALGNHRLQRALLRERLRLHLREEGPGAEKAGCDDDKKDRAAHKEPRDWVTWCTA